MAEEETTSGATSAKVKFLCSHGGKILPRPSDGQLKYVGGETRIICVRRLISFSDLMEKLSNMFEGDFILKYQIGSEELDALVSVKSDEDLHHMLDEYDRLERNGVSKLRAFLFPTRPTLTEIHSPIYPNVESLEQRFVDAVNGITRPTNTKPSSSRLKSMSASQSECTSPHSPSSMMNFESAPFGSTRINKVHSSPNLFSLANHSPPQSNSHLSIRNHRPYHYQTRHNQHHHHYHHNQANQQYHSGHHVARDGFGRVLSMSNLAPASHNLAPASHQSSSPYSSHFSKGHNRWAYLGKPPAASGDSFTRTSTNVSPSYRRVVWE